MGLGHWWFVLGLGILGSVVAITDIMDIIKANERGPLLTESIWRSRLHRGNQRLVSPEAERDIKLMVTILSVEHYLLMVFGVMQANPALLMPWLTMEAIIIALEAIFFGMRLFVEGLAISRAEVIMSGSSILLTLNEMPNTLPEEVEARMKEERNLFRSFIISKRTMLPVALRIQKRDTHKDSGEKANIDKPKKEPDVEVTLPPEPTHCCMSGCANCVWIKYAQELAQLFDNGDVIAKNKISEKVHDPKLRAFLLTQLGLNDTANKN